MERQERVDPIFGLPVLEPSAMQRAWLRAAEEMLACPYYASTGDRKCVTGCYDEPACITDRPEGGWPGEGRVADVEGAHEMALAEDEHWRIVEYETLQAEHIAAAGWPDWDEYR